MNGNSKSYKLEYSVNPRFYATGIVWNMELNRITQSLQNFLHLDTGNSVSSEFNERHCRLTEYNGRKKYWLWQYHRHSQICLEGSPSATWKWLLLTGCREYLLQKNTTIRVFHGHEDWYSLFQQLPSTDNFWSQATALARDSIFLCWS